MRPHLAVATVSLCVLVCAGCSAPPASAPGSSGGGTPAAGAPSPGTGTPIAPGRTAKRGGRVEVVGTLTRDASGQWTIVAAVPSQANGAKALAVIVNPDSIAQGRPEQLDGSYVRLTGTASNGIATDTSNLSVIADTITTLTAR